MESINAVRREANNLRQKIDPDLVSLKASDVIARAIKDQGLSVDELFPNNPILAGGLGVLKRKRQSIFVSKAMEDDLKAEVIAHEVGHFVIHLEPEVNIPGAFSSAGIGDPLQRVEAYSKRERREAQANVFARELLLPRSLARRLFREGMKADRIAQELGLRPETVFQQLVDSLLLPEPQSGAEIGRAHV